MERRFFVSSTCYLVLLFVFNQFAFAQNPKPFVVPAIQEWEGGTGYFKLSKSLTIGGELDMDTLNRVFAEDLKAMYPDLKVHTYNYRVKQAIDISFTIDKKLNMPEEAYRIEVGNGIKISASAKKGAFWATRTVLQLLEQSKSARNIPKGKIYDYPKYALRGFVLDVGRKFFDINFLRDYVKMLSYYKFNDFQIHLNDNGFKQFFGNDWSKTYSAFRLENTSYPGLTAKDGHYSKQEFIALQQLGRAYHVKIVPEIDVPAHALAFSKSVPEIGSKKYGEDHLDLANPRTYRVLDSVFKEYLSGPNPTFINDEVHIGTDEYAKSEAEAFRAFTDHYIKLVQSYGKTVRLWGALTHAKGNTPVSVEGVNMNVWYNGYADPKEMLKLGYDIISTPDGWLYIVPAAGYYYDYLNNKNIYDKWTPSVVGNQTFDEDNKKIKGGSFAVWNDHVGNGITQKDVHDRVFSSIAFLSQKMWGGNKLPLNFEEFEKKAKNIGEGAGLNIGAKVKSKDSLVLFYKNNGLKDATKNGYHALVSNVKKGTDKSLWFDGTSEIITPIKSIGYNYTVDFWLKPASDNRDDAILFSSPDAVVKLKQGNTGKLGFSREGYDYFFNYAVRPNKWTNIAITGNSKGTSLYADGKLVERLEGQKQEFEHTKDKMAKMQTLFFPLKQIGDKRQGFKGSLKHLRVYNRVLKPQTIQQLSGDKK